jgi:hypothetical protein
MAVKIKWLQFLVLFLAAFVTIICEGKPPNIVFMLVDDLGWYDVGYHGASINTDNIDSLCKEGIVLDNYYVQPICTPTRSALMTGRYPIHTGIKNYRSILTKAFGCLFNLILFCCRANTS